jgi:glycosyltransferase involved in cell wall biosynthesis
VKVVVFLNELGIGGVEKAACRWARGLADLGHTVSVLALAGGERERELKDAAIELRITGAQVETIRTALHDFRPDVIHAHAPGHPHLGDVLGEALTSLQKIPVVQTNIFGRLENPKEDVWTSFRLFISWISAVQAARRSFARLDENFFRRSSVAIYPLDPVNTPPSHEIQTFRQALGIGPNEIVFGRLSRPEPNKWTDLPIEAFRMAARKRDEIKLLLREPPVVVRRALETAQDRHRFVILPATNDAAELARTIGALDVVLHTAITGESFGYGIAEPMNFGKPVIANSTPWLDQAQIELVRQGECGYIASTSTTISDRMLMLANDVDLRVRMGRAARAHIRSLADPDESTKRLASILEAAVGGTANQDAREDALRARAAAKYLDKHQFGETWREQIALRLPYYRTRLHEMRTALAYDSWR